MEEIHQDISLVNDENTFGDSYESLSAISGNPRASLFSAKRPKKNLSSKHSVVTQMEESKTQEIIIIQSTLRTIFIRKKFKHRMKLDLKRKNVANEILTTEIDYIKNLQILSMEFLKPLILKKNHKLLGDILVRELTLSLSGIEVILAFHSTTIDDIQQKVNSWNYFSCFGKIFEQMGLFLKSYSQYVNHYQQVVQLLAKRKQDKPFQTLLGELKQQSNGKGLQDYMIMPVQRIPRYAMLLGELFQNTESEHPDYGDLLKCHEKMVRTANHIENESADAQSISKVLELANNFIYNGEPFKLVSPSRRYILESESLSILPFHSVQDNCRVYLFNDLIIWSKKKKDKFLIIHMVNPTNISKLNSTEDDGKTIGSIEMYVQNEKISMIVPKTQDLWIKKLNLILSGAKAWCPHQDQNSYRNSITIQTMKVEEGVGKKVTKKKSLQDLFVKVRDSQKLPGELKGMNNGERTGSPVRALFEEKRAPRFSLVHQSNEEKLNAENNEEKTKSLKFTLENPKAVFVVTEGKVTPLHTRSDFNEQKSEQKPILNRSKSVDGKGLFNLQNSNVKMIQRSKAKDSTPDLSTPVKRNKRDEYFIELAPNKGEGTPNKSPKKQEKSPKKGELTFGVLKSFSEYTQKSKFDSDTESEDETTSNNNKVLKPARKSISSISRSENKPKPRSTRISKTQKLTKSLRSGSASSVNSLNVVSNTNTNNGKKRLSSKIQGQSKIKIKVSIDEDLENNKDKSDLDLLRQIIEEHNRQSSLAENNENNQTIDCNNDNNDGNNDSNNNDENKEGEAKIGRNKFQSKIQIKVSIDHELLKKEKSDIDIIKEIIEEHNRSSDNNVENKKNDEDIIESIDEIKNRPIGRKRSTDVYFTIEKTHSPKDNDDIPIVTKSKSKIQLAVSLDEINAIKGKNEMDLLREIIAEHNRLLDNDNSNQSNNSNNNDNDESNSENNSFTDTSEDIAINNNDDDKTINDFPTSDNEDITTKLNSSLSNNNIAEKAVPIRKIKSGDQMNFGVTSEIISETPQKSTRTRSSNEKSAKSAFLSLANKSSEKLKIPGFRKKSAGDTPSNMSSPIILQGSKKRAKKIKSEDDNFFSLLSPRYLPARKGSSNSILSFDDGFECKKSSLTVRIDEDTFTSKKRRSFHKSLGKTISSRHISVSANNSDED